MSYCNCSKKKTKGSKKDKRRSSKRGSFVCYNVFVFLCFLFVIANLVKFNYIIQIYSPKFFIFNNGFLCIYFFFLLKMTAKKKIEKKNKTKKIQPRRANCFREQKNNKPSHDGRSCWCCKLKFVPQIQIWCKMFVEGFEVGFLQ